MKAALNSIHLLLIKYFSDGPFDFSFDDLVCSIDREIFQSNLSKRHNPIKCVFPSQKMFDMLYYVFRGDSL